MNITAVISQIDSEILRLQQARAAIVGLQLPAKRGPGRPKGSLKKSSKKKRTMSPDARARIAAAQKKRWAAAKKEKQS